MDGMEYSYSGLANGKSGASRWKKVRRSGLRTRTCIDVIVNVTSCVSLAVSVVALVLGGLLLRDLGYSSPILGRRGVAGAAMESLCFPCSTGRGLEGNSDVDDWLARVVGRGRESVDHGGVGDETEGRKDGCCAEDANQLAAMLDKILDEAETAENRKDPLTNDDPVCNGSYVRLRRAKNGTVRCLVPVAGLPLSLPTAAHLVPDHASPTVSEGSNDEVGRLRLSSSSGRSFCRGGLDCPSSSASSSSSSASSSSSSSYSASSVQILQSNLSGLYFIYSQVSYSLSSPRDPDESVTHSIKRFNDRYPNGGVQVLFQHTASVSAPRSAPSASSPSSPISPPVTDSSFLGGLVRVATHDRIYVELSHPGSVNPRQTATFFGMYRI